MMGWYQDGWGSGANGWWGMGLMLVLWVGVLAVLVWGVARLTGGPRQARPTLESPRSVLDRRLAAGDIDAEQYAEARRLLDGQGAQETTAGA